MKKLLILLVLFFSVSIFPEEIKVLDSKIIEVENEEKIELVFSWSGDEDYKYIEIIGELYENIDGNSDFGFKKYIDKTKIKRLDNIYFYSYLIEEDYEMFERKIEDYEYLFLKFISDKEILELEVPNIELHLLKENLNKIKRLDME